jgi:hypothetical protein
MRCQKPRRKSRLSVTPSSGAAVSFPRTAFTNGCELDAKKNNHTTLAWRPASYLRLRDYGTGGEIRKTTSSKPDAKEVVECLKPFDARLMKKYPVSPRVNRPENDDEECAREVAVESTNLTLFQN